MKITKLTIEDCLNIQYCILQVLSEKCTLRFNDKLEKLNKKMTGIINGYIK